LINRRHFFELAQKEFNRAKRYELPMSISMIDIDHFKEINDQYGHMMGDNILYQFSNLFTKYIRDMDILARYGGEEFVILFPHTDGQEALDSAERIRAMIEETKFPLEGKDIHLTISMGIASYLDHRPSDIYALLELADKALYQSKDEGRNKVSVWNLSDEN
jgi:diguanylate cyclase (GGDEF)-like protein